MSSIGNCARCGVTKKSLPIFMFRPVGEASRPPQAERVCGDCLTDEEIERELRPAVAFVLGVAVKRFQDEERYRSLITATEVVRTMYAIRNNDPEDQSGRKAAIKALGLD